MQNPYLLAPVRAAAWSKGFLSGFVNPGLSIIPPSDLPEDASEAFSEGVEAGNASSASGLALDSPCIAAGEPESLPKIGAHVGGTVFEAIMVAKDLAKVSAGVLGGILLIINASIAVTAGMQAPEEVLPAYGPMIADAFNELSGGNLELFCGIGLDPKSERCEMLLSPLFKSIGQARDAVKAMHRPNGMIISWRTDMCNDFEHFKIVEWYGE